MLMGILTVVNILWHRSLRKQGLPTTWNPLLAVPLLCSLVFGVVLFAAHFINS